MKGLFKMTRFRNRVAAFIFMMVFAFQATAFATVQEAQAAQFSSQVVATGDAVIQEIVTEYVENGTTHFVFDNLPNVYEVGNYVHANLPYNIFSWSKTYTFNWGTGRQLVIDFQNNDEEHDKAMEVIREQAEAIMAQGGTQKDWFDRAFHQVGDNIVYDDTITEARREQTIYGAVLDYVAVCNGYASYMAALLNEMDIPAYKVHTKNTAVVNDVGHAVVMFYMDGEWWYSDPTSYSYNKQVSGNGYKEVYLQAKELKGTNVLNGSNISVELAEKVRVATAA